MREKSSKPSPVRHTLAVAAREVKPAVVNVCHCPLVDRSTARGQLSEALLRPLPGLPHAVKVAGPGGEMRQLHGYGGGGGTASKVGEMVRRRRAKAEAGWGGGGQLGEAGSGVGEMGSQSS